MCYCKTWPLCQGGIETWDLKKRDFKTEVTHTLVYKIHRWIYKVGWFLLGGEKKHDELTELALLRLKSLLERNAPSPPPSPREGEGFVVSSVEWEG